MPFGFDPIKMAKAEILKLNFDKDATPDVLEALDAAEKGCDDLAALLKYLDAKDIRLILEALPSAVKAKLPPGAIDKAADGFAALPAGLAAAKKVLESIESELKRK